MPRSRLSWRRQSWALAMLVSATLVPVARAHEPTDYPGNRINLSATARAEVVMDTLTVTLRVQREGSEAATVQAQIKQVLDQGLAEARRQVVAGDAQALSVSTGAFQIGPRYGRDGKVNGWSGSADLMLQGRDGARVAATAGRLGSVAAAAAASSAGASSGLVVVSSGYSVSTALRDQQQAELTGRAIDQFRARADEVARRFGFSRYELGEVAIQGEYGEGVVRPMAVMAMRSVAQPADAAPLPTEAGRASLGMTVQGTIRLVR